MQELNTEVVNLNSKEVQQGNKKNSVTNALE
jgi:hypothetical protein